MPPFLHRTSNHTKKAADDTTPAPNNNPKLATKMSGGKHVCETEDTIIESEKAPAKKTKIPDMVDTQPDLRQSERSPKPNAKAIIEKRKH